LNFPSARGAGAQFGLQVAPPVDVEEEENRWCARRRTKSLGMETSGARAEENELRMETLCAGTDEDKLGMETGGTGVEEDEL
jgi:hypothetical protein